MTYFTGFDSAWGGRAPGAMCHLRAVGDGALEFVAAPRRLGWDEAIDEIAAWSSWTDHVVAIDQSLVVPNATGLRPVERRLASALMSPFGCGAHASNTGNSACFGAAAGIWRFTGALDGLGYRQHPMAVARREPGRFYFECYPHPAFLGLFDLDVILRYKCRARDDAGWSEALRLVRSLGAEGRAPRLLGLAAHVPSRWTRTKEHEDLLDAIVCAYVAAHRWTVGAAASRVIGSLQTGYMVTPVSARTDAALRRVFGAEIDPEGEARSFSPR